MRDYSRITLALPVAALLAGAATTASATDTTDGSLIKARLSGYQEVPVPDNPAAPGSLSSPGSGEFRGRVGAASIEFELSYEGLETPVLQAHIHFGQRHTNGGIVVFLCADDPPSETIPECPDIEGTVTGVITAENVGGGAAAQGLEPGEFDELVDAIRAGATYANVHTEAYPAGELRGQIKTLDLFRR